MSEHIPRSEAFVATEQIPASPPPPGSTGIVMWVRENLFPDILNGTLTVLSIAFLVWLLPGVIEWAFIHSVSDADSLDGCRALMDERYGEGVRGACWAVIAERMEQFAYGFYPPELRWRPNMVMGLLVLALLPVLFDGLPFRRLLFVFTAIFPAAAYFLIWGGSIWGPILVMATPLVAYIAYIVINGALDDLLGEDLTPPLAMIGSVFAIAFWLLFGVAAVDEALTRSVADARMPDRVAELNAVANDGAAEESAREAARAERDNLLSLDEQRAELSGLKLDLAAMGAEVIRTADGDQSVEEFVEDELNASQDIQNAALQALSAEDREKAEAYQALESRVTGEETRLWNTYKTLGRIGLEPVESAKLGGFLLTLIIGVTAISASLPIGVLLALGRRSGLIFIRMVSVVIIEAIRGVPLITLLFVASTLLNYFLPPGTSFDIILRVLILATLFSAAYIAEAIRGGLAALPKGQYEAGDAMGLTYWQSMRLIILPQALKISIPSIVNIFIGLFKDTTLVSIIGLLDPLGIIQPILADARWQGIVAELYVFVAFFFFIFCFAMSRYSMYLERKLKTDHR